MSNSEELDRIPPVSAAGPMSYAVAPLPAAIDLSFPRLPVKPLQAFLDIVVMLVVLVGFALFTRASSLSRFLAGIAPGGDIYLWILINGTLAMVGVIALTARHKLGPASLGLGRKSIARIVGAAFIAVPLCFATGFISNLVMIFLRGMDFNEFIQERSGFITTVSEIPIAWVFPVSLFVGIYEEILFRGFLLPRLRAITHSSIAAVVISAAVFGSVHFSQGPFGMAQTALIGLVLGSIVVYVRSLWPSILAHAAIDTISLVLAYFLRPMLEDLLRETMAAPAELLWTLIRIHGG